MGVDTLHIAVLMLQGSGSDVWLHQRSIPMTKSFQRQCQCCGASFMAGHPAAKWCSSRCTMRAYYRRRSGKPEADSNLAIVPFKAEDQELPLWAQDTAGTTERYWHGTAIQRRQDDGFANATAMCDANGREWFTYARADRTTEYITALASSLNLSPAQLVITTATGPNALRGTWIHPRLAIDLARWISPQFAVWMDGWFLESLNRPQQPQQHTLPLTPGIHVVASNPRQANWLWGLAVEQHVSSALMTQIAADNSRRSQPSYQLYLLP